ncbi:MerR family transcriptional regulator [Nocardiopsis sp. HNM0947]|uniref:MerR family transcriptional regulator n=1 Tax=Nocardiopsis coralli TaxID=2772213 RepID=A0ABR9PD19_9ACTN|nr:MerR family transcriptional regulator [Nocardiopsis coralli]MBE3001729.1 MerR family transcriptional regulator [Nocardiopsis coralli]
MRISELSEHSGSPVPSIKYYLREGLLHRGERTSPNQARYDGSHVRRLRLIRALTEVGGLSLADTRSLLEGIDGNSVSNHDLLGRTLMTVDSGGREPAGPEGGDLELADALAEQQGWFVYPDSPMRHRLAQILATFRSLGMELDRDWLDSYAEAAEQLAQADMQYVEGLTDVDELLEKAVVGTVLGDSLLASLRRLAQASASRDRQRP